MRASARHVNVHVDVDVHLNAHVEVHVDMRVELRFPLRKCACAMWMRVRIYGYACGRAHAFSESLRLGTLMKTRCVNCELLFSNSKNLLRVWWAESVRYILSSPQDLVQCHN
jgi:hypothetical protein